MERHKPLVFSCLCCPFWKGNRPPACPKQDIFNIQMKSLILLSEMVHKQESPFLILTMLYYYIVPSEIHRLAGSASCKPSFPPWLPAHTEVRGSVHVSMSSLNYLKARYIRKVYDARKTMIVQFSLENIQNSLFTSVLRPNKDVRIPRMEFNPTSRASSGI